MLVRTPILLAILGSILLLGPGFAAPPTAEEIQQAVRELGDARFAVREKASKLLWNAGAAAEAPLKAAAQSRDLETARRAKTILDRFDAGIFPDTPKDLIALIDEYRSGDREARSSVIGRMLASGPSGFAALKRLAAKEREADRRIVYAAMAHEAPRGIARSIRTGDLTYAEGLLDFCLASETEEAAGNYAAFQLLRGTLDAAIARWDADWRKTRSKPSAFLLAHLYKAKGDFPAAGKAAAAADSDALVEQVLWEASDWKGLAARAPKPTANDALTVGAWAAFQRLAGDAAGFAKSLERIHKLGEANDSFDVRTAAEALLLNERPAEAIEMLLQRKKNVALTFDLLCARLQYKEAFAVAAAVKGLPAEEQFTLDLRRARAHFQLGEKDASLQILNRLADELKDAGQATSARDLIKMLIRLNLKDRAAEVCAQYLDLLHKANSDESFGQLLEPVFGKDAESAEAWWRFLRGQFPKESPAGALRKVRRLLAGQAVEGGEGWIAQVAAVRPATHDTDGGSGPVAAAVVLHRAGEIDTACGVLMAAIQRKPSYAAALRLGDLRAEQKRHKEAAQAYDQAAAADPGQALAVFLRGQALIATGDAAAGKRLAELAHWVPLGDEQARSDFADELDRRGYTAEAWRERELALTVGWYSKFAMANLLLHAVRHALHNRDYDQAAVLAEKSVVGCLKLGARYIDNAAYLMQPQSICFLRARGLIAKGRIEEASKEVRASLEVLPGNLDLLIATVPALDRAGRKTEADELFQAMLGRYEQLARDYPNGAFAHNAAAWLGATCRRGLDGALVHAQAAVKLEPQAAGYLDTLAEVHFRRGEKDQAVELMKRCAALEPKTAYYRKQLVRFAAGDVNSDVPENDNE